MSRAAPPGVGDATVIPRSEHCISRANISEGALKVLYRLKNAGHEAYLVGGGVRDLLLGREPKDFDVATGARPEEVRRLFRNCRLIGRRFRLAHVRYGNEIVEVATFRGRGEPREGERVLVEGRLLRDNVYGTLEEDAWRRDFTVNALYYDIRDFSVVDFTGGMADLRAGVMRLIGDPEVSYHEDPVRILRAVRFAAKLGFRIHPETEAPIRTLGHLLAEVPPARLYEEVLKLFLGGYAAETFELLRHYDVFRHLFPETDACLAEEDQGFPRLLLARALENTDARIDEGKPVTPAFLFAALLWEPVRRQAAFYREEGLGEQAAMEHAGREVIARQAAHVAFPRRFSAVTHEIWSLQPRLARRRGKRALELLAHPRFRAAYDFLVLREQAGEDVGGLVQWWREAQAEGEGEERLPARPPARGRRRRRRRRRGPSADLEGERVG